MTDWQPIQTAPRGREVLVVTVRQEILIATLCDEDGDPYFDEWYLSSDGRTRLFGEREPTHWIALPEPPEFFEFVSGRYPKIIARLAE